MPWVPKASIEEPAAPAGGYAAEPKGESGKKGGKAGGKKGKGKSKKEEPLEVPPPPPVTEDVVMEVQKGGKKGKGKGKSGKSKGGQAKDGGDDFYPRYRDEDEDSSAGKRGGGGKGGKKGKGKGGGGGAKGRGGGGGGGGGGGDDDDAVERAEKSERNNRSDDSRRQAALQKGRHCDVRKHSSMGCAIVTFADPTIRDMVLKESQTATIGGIQVKLKPHYDKEAKENVPTDLFVGWGRQVEKATPLSESKLVEYFDGKHEEFHSVGPSSVSLQLQQAMQRQMAAGTAGRGCPPGAVPQVSSASTASRVPSSMANAALLQQQNQALQAQQQQQWLAQMQQAQAYYYHMLYQQQAMAAYAAQQQQASAHEPPQDRDRTGQQRGSNRIKPAYRRPTEEELQATIGAISGKTQPPS